MNDRTFHVSDAHKLEDPERLAWLPPGEVLGHLGSIEGLNIADIGAGTGYFALPFAHGTGAKGRVFAVDFQEGMLTLIRRKLAGTDTLGNVTLLHGEAADTGLQANSCDIVFLANVWHELDKTDNVLGEIRRVLRQGGRLAILDWRADTAPPPGPPAAHRVSEENLNSSLRRRGWNAAPPVHVGMYHYLQVASLP
ncbi:MAG TPA: methyltransferase domain-containing protein [Bacteroidota bacterium]|nr:methyltransferase domain-containing protein [Bacteroidota bacterium]